MPTIHSETTLPSQLRRAFRFFLACPPYRPGDVLRHANAFVCLPHGDTLPHPGPCTPRLAPAMRSTITTTPFQFATALPVIDSATNCRSNPIAHRVRRKHQRLPPSLLIENASDSLNSLPHAEVAHYELIVRFFIIRLSKSRLPVRHTKPDSLTPESAGSAGACRPATPGIFEKIMHAPAPISVRSRSRVRFRASVRERHV